MSNVRKSVARTISIGTASIGTATTAAFVLAATAVASEPAAMPSTTAPATVVPIVDPLQSLPPAPDNAAKGNAPAPPRINATVETAAAPMPATAVIERIRTDVPPYTDRGVAMAPLRPLSQFLGFEVEYRDGIIILSKRPDDGPLTTVTLRTGGTTAQIQTGEARRSVRLPLPIEVRIGTVFLPLRFIVEIFGGALRFEPEGNVNLIYHGDRIGVLTPTAQEGYRGADAARLTIVNRTGRALSLRLTGPQNMAIELGRNQSIVRSLRPGVYYYRAAATGLKTRTGARRLLAHRKATWAWGRR